ncbi:hypothetical protein B0H34DRAFT_735827 [Crassisporium funariophilum]|nr:hypothetical protein B0H34DRAFT_735827 [Crassisporium funariophilum]
MVGRYKDGKCVEKWGPGPMGPGTVCDRCVPFLCRERGSDGMGRWWRRAVGIGRCSYPLLFRVFKIPWLTCTFLLATDVGRK